MNAGEKLPNIKEEVPAHCLTCANYKPLFFTVRGKECAMFGSVKGVDPGRCWAWEKRLPTPETG